MGSDIIDFMEYVRKRRDASRETVTPEDVEAFCDLPDKTVSTISTICSYARYSLFIRTLLYRNKDSESRNTGFLIGFVPDHLTHMNGSICRAISDSGRVMRGVDAAGKSYIDVVSEVTGIGCSSNIEADETMTSYLCDSDNIVVVKGFSSSKIANKGSLLRGWIKTLDDAHFEGIVPNAELIIIDYAAFLQRVWSSIGHYLNILVYSEAEGEF